MKWVKFNQKYGAGIHVVSLARVGIPIQVDDEFAKLAISEGAAVPCDPGEGPLVPQADEPEKLDKQERGEKAKGRREK